MVLQELVPLLNQFRKQQSDTTILPTRTRKTESEISYGPAEGDHQFCKVKSLLKRKSRENYKKMKKFMRDNFGEDEKEQFKKDDRKRKKKMCDNFDKKIFKKEGNKKNTNKT